MFGFKPDPEGLLDALPNCLVTRHGYRKAYPSHPRLCEPVGFNMDDTWRKLQLALAKKCGKGYDNHETYLIQDEFSPEQICIQFSDWGVHIGADVIVKDW